MPGGMPPQGAQPGQRPQGGQQARQQGAPQGAAPQAPRMRMPEIYDMLPEYTLPSMPEL